MRNIFVLVLLVSGGWYLAHHPHALSQFAASAPSARDAARQYAGPLVQFAIQRQRDTIGATAPSPSGAELVSLGAVLGAIDHAQTVTATAYTLSGRSGVFAHLRAASARGAHVSLVLTGVGMGYAVAANRRMYADNPAMHIILSRGMLHLKAVVIDGGKGGVYVSDRNWAAGRSLIVMLPSRYAFAVERAAAGDPHDTGTLTLTKGSSLEREAQLLRSARRSIDLESESFGDGNVVFDALLEAAQRGVHVHVLVSSSELNGKGSEREHAALAMLQQHNIEIGTSTSSQKLAVVDERNVWFGSSNATSGLSEQVEWGYSTAQASVVRDVERSFAGDAGV